MEQALPLDDVLFDPSVEETGDISNMTAEEYLSWVRYMLCFTFICLLTFCM